MDENDVVKVGMEVALRPVTEVAENVLGILGGDWLSEKRARNRARLHAETEKVLRKSGAEIDQDPSPNVVLPLLSAAQDDSREELIQIWAKLLATAMDPNRRSLYRREFVDIVKKLDPADALVLQALPPSGDWFYASDFEVGLSEDQVLAAFNNLGRLELIISGKSGSNWTSTGKGRLLQTALRD
jgi:hypothetical protein